MVTASPTESLATPHSLSVTALPSPFPARSKEAVGLVNNIRTEVSATYFADKILVTLSQDGRLAHWVHVPLVSTDDNISSRRLFPASSVDEEDNPDSDLLPMSHLTATTILGGSTGTERDTLGRLYGAQIASAIVGKNPDEKRLLVLGLGLRSGKIEGSLNTEEEKLRDREAFVDMLGLVFRCL